MYGDLQLFALDASRDFGARIGRELGVPLAEHEEREFEDGEHKARPLENVRGRDVFVVQSLYGSPTATVHDKLCRLFFFLGALRDAGAGRITAVVPYLCYARKDRKTKSYDPVTTRYVAQLFEAVGTDAIITLDVHNLAAFQNAFRLRTDHLEARTLFVDYLARLLEKREAAVVSPDVGGVKRADALREGLAERLGRPVASGFMEKHRSRGVVSGETFVGSVEGRSVILIDDLISTGTTMTRAAEACRTRGAYAVYAVATHGLFVDADDNLRRGGYERVVVTDTVSAFRMDETLAAEKLHIVESAPLFAEAIERTHTGGSVEELIDKAG